MRIESRDLTELASLYDQNHFYTKAFKNLLTAITQNDIKSLDKVPDEILYAYVANRDKLQQFFDREINEPLYESDAYNGLMSMKLDLYAVMHTMINLRKEITDISIQPDEVVNEYLDSFGFPAKHLFGPQQRRGIAQNVYGYLRKKGTPALLGRLLNQLNYQNFYLGEYWLHHVNDEIRYPGERYLVRPEIIWDNNTDLSREVFVPAVHTLTDLDDPLWTLSADDLDQLDVDERITFPMKTAYYAMGLVFDWATYGTIFSLLHSALLKQVRMRRSVGEDVNDIYISGFPNTVSYISLTYAYALVLSDLSGGIVPLSPILPTDTMMQWQGAVYTETPNGKKFINPKTIYKTIVKEVKRYYALPSYSPPGQPDDLSPLKRKEKLLSEIKTHFYGPVVENVAYDAFVKTFEAHDPTFCAWLISSLESAGTDRYGVDAKFELLNIFGEAFENYFFEHCHTYIPVRQIILSQRNLIRAMLELDKYFTPYHSHLLDLNNIYVINDVPGDCVAYEEKLKTHGTINVFDWWFEPYFSMSNHFTWVDGSGTPVQVDTKLLHRQIGNVVYYPFLYNNEKWDIVLVDGLHKMHELIVFNNPYQFTHAPDCQGTIHRSMPKDIPRPREFTDIYIDYGIWNTIRWTVGMIAFYERAKISDFVGKEQGVSRLFESIKSPMEALETLLHSVIKTNLETMHEHPYTSALLLYTDHITTWDSTWHHGTISISDDADHYQNNRHELIYTDRVEDVIIFNNPYQFSQAPDMQGTIHRSMPRDIPTIREFVDLYSDYGVWNTIRWTAVGVRASDVVTLVEPLEVAVIHETR